MTKATKVAAGNTCSEPTPAQMTYLSRLCAQSGDRFPERAAKRLGLPTRLRRETASQLIEALAAEMASAAE